MDTISKGSDLQKDAECALTFTHEKVLIWFKVIAHPLPTITLWMKH